MSGRARISSSIRRRSAAPRPAPLAALRAARSWRPWSRRRPPGDEWLHEIKFDGYRAIATDREGRGHDVLAQRQGLDRPLRGHRRRAGPPAGARAPCSTARWSCVLPDGRTSFQELQNALGAQARTGRGDGAGRLLYYVFDLLHLDGYDLTRAAIEDRKDLLRRLLARAGQGGRLLYSEHIAGGGAGRPRAGLPAWGSRGS